jgi:hypothetical protein
MSIEAMKQAVATIDKIIDGCNNVQEEKDIHGDAKTLAKLIKKDCFPTLEALCQAIAGAEDAVAAERNRIVNLLLTQHEAAKDRHNYWTVAANLIQADVASDT